MISGFLNINLPGQVLFTLQTCNVIKQTGQLHETCNRNAIDSRRYLLTRDVT